MLAFQFEENARKLVSRIMILLKLVMMVMNGLKFVFFRSLISLLSPRKLTNKYSALSHSFFLSFSLSLRLVLGYYAPPFLALSFLSSQILAFTN